MYPIIDSLLQSDLYKFTQGQLALKMYPDVQVRYKFKDRNSTKYPPGFGYKLRDHINMMSTLSLTVDETNMLSILYEYFDNDYIEWLSRYRFDPKEVLINQWEDGRLSIDIEGSWKRAIYWEVPLLALISELYYQEMEITPLANKETSSEKAKRIQENKLLVTEFGTRRRFSADVQKEMYKTMKNSLIGTSNVRIAMDYGESTRGTYAHEWVMAHSALFGIESANSESLKAWKNGYKRHMGTLGTALPDTYTTEFFFKSVSSSDLEGFYAFRQDSGDPSESINKIIEGLRTHRRTRLDPHGSYIIMPSDALTVDKAVELNNEFMLGSGSGLVFGIGTHLSNDVSAKPLNIVIKPHEFSSPYRNVHTGKVHHEWHQVAKLSDSPGKYAGSKQAIENALEAVNK